MMSETTAIATRSQVSAMLLEIKPSSNPSPHDEAKDCDESINDAKDFEECLGRTNTRHTGEGCDHAG